MTDFSTPGARQEALKAWRASVRNSPRTVKIRRDRFWSRVFYVASLVLLVASLITSLVWPHVALWLWAISMVPSGKIIAEGFGR